MDNELIYNKIRLYHLLGKYIEELDGYQKQLKEDGDEGIDDVLQFFAKAQAYVEDDLNAHIETMTPDTLVKLFGY